MSDTNLTLRMRALADLSQLQRWNSELERTSLGLTKLRDATRSYNTEAGKGGSATGGGSGGGGGGGGGGGSRGGDEGPTIIMAAPLPSAAPAPGPAPPLPGAPASASPSATLMNTPVPASQYSPGWGPNGQEEPEGRRSGGGGRAPMGRVEKFARGAGNFAANAGSTALGVTIGGSILGLLTTSAEVFMRNSKAITELGRRFREAEGYVASFGGTYAYTVQESAQIATSYGRQLNVFDQSQASRVVGFARYTGTDPNASAGTFGRMDRLSGGRMGDREMSWLLGRARASGMDGGRLPEFMDTAGSLAEEQFSRTGRLRAATLAQTLALPGQVFGDQDPRAQGQDAAGFLGRMQSGFETNPTSTFLLRTMGYGTPGGPSYRDMRRRLEAGVQDPRNVFDVLKGISGFGFGDDATFQAIEGAFPQLRVHELDAMTDLVRDPKRMEKLGGLVKNGDIGGAQAFLDNVQKKGEGGEFAAGGFAELGKGKAGIGEAAAVQWEGIQMAIGEPVTKLILGGREILGNLIGAFENLIGVNWQTVAGKLEKGMDALVLMSGKLEEGTKRGGAVREAFADAVPWVGLGQDIYAARGGNGAVGSGSAGYDTFVDFMANGGLDAYRHYQAMHEPGAAPNKTGGR